MQSIQAYTLPTREYGHYCDGNYESPRVILRMGVGRVTYQSSDLQERELNQDVLRGRTVDRSYIRD